MNHDEAVIVGAALFELQWAVLPEGVRVACASAIRARVELLMQASATPAPIPASAGLISGASVLDVLARRTMNDGAWQKALEMSPPYWYSQYCINLFELAEVAQRSVVGGRLKLRSASTRVELPLDALSFWVSTDLAAKHREGLELLADCADWEPTSRAWFDIWMAMPGAVLLSEADDWAASEGIAEPGELARLLGLVESVAGTGADVVPLELVRNDSKGNDPPLKTWDDLVNFRGQNEGADWSQVQANILRAEEAKRKAKPGAKGVRKGLGQELGMTDKRIGQVLREYSASSESGGPEQGGNAGNEPAESLDDAVKGWHGKGGAR